MYCLIETMEKGKKMVSGVPQNWLFGKKKVMWPNTKNATKIRKAIHQLQLPNHDWLIYDCIILKDGIGTITTILKGCIII